MAVLAIVLYKMVMAHAVKTENRIIYQSSSVTPLGGIRSAGIIWHIRGETQWGRELRWVSFGLVYTLNGACRYWNEKVGERPIRKGDLILLFPDVPHRYGTGLDEDWEEFYIVFDGPIFDLWRERGLITPESPIVHLEPVSYWHHRLESCLDSHGAIGQAAALHQICNLQTLLTEMTCYASNQSEALLKAPWVEQACIILSGEESQNLDLPGVARSLGVSFETFRKTFLQIMGISPGRYQAARLMDRAMRDVRHSRGLDKTSMIW